MDFFSPEPVEVPEEEVERLRLCKANNLSSSAIPKSLDKFCKRKSKDEIEFYQKQWALMTKNVFQAPDSLTTKDKVKMGLLFWLAFLRLLLLVVLGLIFMLVLVLTTIRSDTTKPLSKRTLKLQNWLGYFMAKTFQIVLGLVVTVKGKPCELDEALVQVGAPHSTFLDGPAVLIANKGQFASMVGKIEASGGPIGRRLFAWMQNVFVDRANKDSRSAAAGALIERATEKIWGRKVALFPEGTCINRTKLARFATGAFRAGVPVQPVVLRWDNEIQWTGGSKSRSRILFRSLCELFHAVEVEFLDVYAPTQQEIDDPVLFSNNVRRVCADALELDVCEASFMDRLLARRVGKAHVDVGHVLDFYYEDLVSALKTTRGEAEKSEFFYSEAQMEKMVKAELENLLNLFLKACEKPTGLLSATQHNSIIPIENTNVPIFSKNLESGDAFASMMLLNNLDFDLVADGQEFVSFRRFSFAYFEQKYLKPK